MLRKLIESIPEQEIIDIHGIRHDGMCKKKAVLDELDKVELDEEKLYNIISDFMSPSKEDKLLSTLVKTIIKSFNNGELIK